MDEKVQFARGRNTSEDILVVGANELLPAESVLDDLFSDFGGQNPFFQFILDMRLLEGKADRGGLDPDR